MKSLFCAIAVAAGVPGMLSADGQQEFPNLQKAFLTEQLKVAHREGAVEWYLLETDLEFTALKDKLLEFLGRGWSPVEHDRDAEQGIRGGVDGPKLLDMVVIKNREHPGITVSFDLTERRSHDGTKQRCANILRSDSNKEGARRITPGKLTRTAAESGSAWAQRVLGFEYLTGQGGEKNVAEAVRWWRMAAAQGEALAQSGLAGCFLPGQGVTQDQAAAVELFRKAAAQGLPDAHYALATCYDEGKGVAANSAEALKHYLIAAGGNYARAQFNLEVIYFLGESVQKNPVEAYAWLTLSNKQSGQAQPQLEDLEKRLPPETITAGKKRCDELAKVIAANLTRRKKATPGK